MRLLDGIPVPADVDGRTVQKAFPTEHGRVRLVLDGGSKTLGCVDCPTTHPHWAAMARHRTEKHGEVPCHPKGRRPAAAQADGQGELDLRPGPGAQPAQADVGAAEEHPAPDVIAGVQGEVQAGRPARVVRVPSGDAILAMQLGELFTLAGQVLDVGKELEKLAADRDRWKRRAKAAEADLAKLNTLVGRARNVLNKEES